tara:strand:- start:11144 stop:14926 length:3783 start_codon:yes stop_codon:yes gene_type:complete
MKIVLDSGSRNYIYVDKNEKLQLMMPFVGGQGVGVDNTCKTFLEMKQFFSDSGAYQEVKNNLDGYLKIVSLLSKITPGSTRHEKILDMCKELKHYLDLINVYARRPDIFAMTYDQYPKAPAFFDEYFKNEGAKSLQAMILRPLQMDSYLRAKNVQFSLDRTYTEEGNKGISQLLISSELQVPRDTAIEELKLLVEGYAGDLKTNTNQQISEFFLKTIQNPKYHMFSAVRGTSIDILKQGLDAVFMGTDFTEEDIPDLLDTIIGVLGVNISFELNPIQASYMPPPAINNKVSIAVQFFLATINLEYKAYGLTKSNWGEIIDNENDSRYREEIVKIVNDNFSTVSKESIEDKLLDYFEQNMSSFGIDPDSYTHHYKQDKQQKRDQLIEKYKSLWLTVNESQHFDEFILVNPEIKGSYWCNYGGAISTPFALLTLESGLELTPEQEKFCKQKKEEFLDLNLEIAPTPGRLMQSAMNNEVSIPFDEDEVHNIIESLDSTFDDADFKIVFDDKDSIEEGIRYYISHFDITNLEIYDRLPLFIDHIDPFQFREYLGELVSPSLIVGDDYHFVRALSQSKSSASYLALYFNSGAANIEDLDSQTLAILFSAITPGKLSFAAYLTKENKYHLLKQYFWAKYELDTTLPPILNVLNKLNVGFTSEEFVSFLSDITKGKESAQDDIIRSFISNKDYSMLEKYCEKLDIELGVKYLEMAIVQRADVLIKSISQQEGIIEQFVDSWVDAFNKNNYSEDSVVFGGYNFIEKFSVLAKFAYEDDVVRDILEKIIPRINRLKVLDEMSAHIGENNDEFAGMPFFSLFIFSDSMRAAILSNEMYIQKIFSGLHSLYNPYNSNKFYEAMTKMILSVGKIGLQPFLEKILDEFGGTLEEKHLLDDLVRDLASENHLEAASYLINRYPAHVNLAGYTGTLVFRNDKEIARFTSSYIKFTLSNNPIFYLGRLFRILADCQPHAFDKCSEIIFNDENIMRLLLLDHEGAQAMLNENAHMRGYSERLFDRFVEEVPNAQDVLLKNIRAWPTSYFKMLMVDKKFAQLREKIFSNLDNDMKEQSLNLLFCWSEKYLEVNQSIPDELMTKFLQKKVRVRYLSDKQKYSENQTKIINSFAKQHIQLGSPVDGSWICFISDQLDKCQPGNDVFSSFDNKKFWQEIVSKNQFSQIEDLLGGNSFENINILYLMNRNGALQILVNRLTSPLYKDDSQEKLFRYIDRIFNMERSPQHVDNTSFSKLKSDYNSYKKGQDPPRESVFQGVKP